MGCAMTIRNAKEFGQAIRDRRKIMFVSQLEGGKPTAQLEKAIRVANRVGLDLNFQERG